MDYEHKITRKGYGRIIVFDENHVEKVIEIIKKLDAFEYNYMPKDFVVSFSSDIRLIYTHKFEINVDKLTMACYSTNIPIWVIHQENEPDVYQFKFELYDYEDDGTESNSIVQIIK